jgi:uncharacterized membrane protein (UPF0127 family)
VIVINATKNALLSDRCQFADSFWKRLIGLLGRKAMAEGEGLLLDRCQAIHTFGMRFPIDVVWLDENFRVLQTTVNLLPFRACVQKGATFVIELAAGTIRPTHTTVGDQIQIRDNNVTAA